MEPAVGVIRVSIEFTPLRLSGAGLVIRSRIIEDNLSYTQMMKLYQQVLVEIDDIDELSKQELLQVLEAQRGPVVDPYKEFETGFWNLT